MSQQISLPHFTLQHLQVKPIIIQMAKSRSTIPKVVFSGLIDQHIKESMVRLTVALQPFGITFPKDHITIHFTPAIYEKRGSDYDLALAIGLLYLLERIPHVPEDTLFLSELGLDGQLHGSDHFLAFFHHLLTLPSPLKMITSPPIYSWLATHHAPHHHILPFPSLSALVSQLTADPPTLASPPSSLPICINPTDPKQVPKHAPLLDVQGLPISKLALVCALIARIPLMFIGPPGVGKTLLLSLARDLLPPLTFSEWLEGHLLSNIRDTDAVSLHAPFRAPHYNASLESFVGTFYKGRWMPGEFSLANGGVLFLDELPHFKPQVLDALRTPLEDRHFLLSRAHFHAKLPAHFVLLAAMNPCPCGYYAFNPCACTCTHRQILTYLSRVSGPIRERFAILHLVDPSSEETSPFRNTALHLSSIGPDSITTLRKQFTQHYEPEALHLALHAWQQTTRSTDSWKPNKRTEKHMMRTALALALLDERLNPNPSDWALAWNFQHQAMRFFRTLGQ